jgi:hypothetical protein
MAGNAVILGVDFHRKGAKDRKGNALGFLIVQNENT